MNIMYFSLKSLEIINHSIKEVTITITFHTTCQEVVIFVGPFVCKYRVFKQKLILRLLEEVALYSLFWFIINCDYYVYPLDKMCKWNNQANLHLKTLTEYVSSTVLCQSFFRMKCEFFTWGKNVYTYFYTEGKK